MPISLTRTHPEFYAFHIETDHIHAGHIYTIPEKDQGPKCRDRRLVSHVHRAKYVAGLLEYGYKNVWVL